MGRSDSVKDVRRPTLRTAPAIDLTKIEEDYLELCYSDSAANYLRRFEDRDEFDVALEQRKKDVGDAP